MFSKKPIGLLSLLFATSYALTFLETLEQNDQFSSFRALVETSPALLDAINGGQPKTVLVPTNDAIKVINIEDFSPAEAEAAVRYHILNGTYESKDLNVAGGQTISTYLEASEFVLLSGDPNVVFSSKYGDDGVSDETENISIFSGVGNKADITSKDISFDGGVIHGVDSVLALPQTCTRTAKIAGLNSLLFALDQTDLTTYVDTTDRITCFAPSDEAFGAAGNPEKNLPLADLTTALQHHTLQGAFVGYSDDFEDGMEYETLAGTKLLFTRQDENLFVNGVPIIKANVITKNGVAHVLGGILPVTPPVSNETDAPTPGPSSTSVPSNTSIPSGTGNPPEPTETDTGAAAGRWISVPIAFAVAFAVGVFGLA